MMASASEMSALGQGRLRAVSRARIILMAVLAVMAVLVIAPIIVVQTLDFDRFRPLITEYVREATGRQLEIKGKLDLKLSLTPAIKVDDIRFANAPWGSRRNMVRLKSLRVELKLLPLLTGDIEVSRFVLVGPDVLLETDAKGHGNWVLPAHGTAGKSGPGLPVVHEVRIEDARIRYRNKATGKTTAIALTRASAEAESATSPIRVALNGVFAKTGFQLVAALGSLKALGGDESWPIELNGLMAGAVIKAKGTVFSLLKKPEVDVGVSLAGRNLRDLANLAGGVPLPHRPYRLKARLKGGGEKLAIGAIDARIGKSNLGGTASLILSRPRLALSANLSSSLIEIADFRPPQASRKEARKRLFSGAPLPLAATRATDADIKIRVKRVLAGKVVFSDVAANLALKNGKLTARPLKATIAKGAVTGNLVIDTREKKAKVRAMLKVKQLDIAALLNELNAEKLASGKIDLSTRLRGVGNSVRAIMGGATGRLEIVSGKALVSSKYVDLLGADLLQVVASTDTGTGSSKVNCFVARFGVSDGVARDRGILFDTERMSLKGRGTVDLSNEALDLRFNPKPKDDSQINIALPWRVRGTLMDPSVGPDEASAAKEAAGFVLSAPINLFGSKTSPGADERNPCVAALEGKPASAETAATQGQPTPQEKKSGIERFFDDVGRRIGGIFDN